LNVRRGLIEDFSGVQKVFGVEGALDLFKKGVRARVALEGQVGFFGEADAVFAADGAAAAEGFDGDFAGGGAHALHRRGVAFIGEVGGVEIAVARVAEGGAGDAVTLRGGFNEADHGGEFAAGDGDVFEDGGGAGLRERGIGEAARGGEEFGFRFIFCLAHFEGAVGAGDVRELRGFVGDGGGVAVGFEEQERAGVDGQAKVDDGFDAAEGFLVQEFEGAGEKAGGDDGGDGGGGVFERGEGGEERGLGGGAGQELEENFGDDAERAFGADEQIAEGITGDVFAAFGAEPGEFAIRERDFEGEDVVARDAVFDAAQAAGVAGDVAADGAGFDGAGVGRVK